MATSTTDRLITVTRTTMTSSPPMKTSSSKYSKHGYSHRTKINVPAKFTPLPLKKMDGISNTGSYARKNSWFQMLLEVWNHFVKCHCHGSNFVENECSNDPMTFDLQPIGWSIRHCCCLDYVRYFFCVYRGWYFDSCLVHMYFPYSLGKFSNILLGLSIPVIG